MKFNGRFVEAKVAQGHVDVSDADDTPFPKYNDDGDLVGYEWPEVCATTTNVKATNESENNIHFHAEGDSAAQEKEHADEMNNAEGDLANSGKVTWDYRENDEQNDDDVYHHVFNNGNQTEDNSDKGVWTDTPEYNSDEAAKETSKGSLFNFLKSTNSLGYGEDFQFATTKENVTWSIEEGECGYIDSNGLFTAIDIGTCTVAAESDGEKLTCDVETTWFHGGTGVESDPYQIANYYQWNCLFYNDYGNYYLSNYGTDYGYPAGEYFELVADIDFEGTVPSATCGYYSSPIVHIDGKNHIVMNANGAVFAYGWAGSFAMKDLTFKDCNSNGGIIVDYGSWATNCKQEFINVDMINCRANGGSLYLPWVYDPSYSASFDECDVTNCTIYDDYNQGFVGVFAGNSKDEVSVNNCSALVTIYAERASGGFLLGSGNGKIKNSIVKIGSAFYQKNAEQTASAFGGATRTDCQFYGTIYSKTRSQANMQDFETGYWCCSDSGYYASDFIINNDGSIQYTGEKEIAKVKFAQSFSLTRLYIHTGKIDGGLGAMLEESELFTNVASGQTITNAIHYITNVYNVTAGDNNELFTHTIDTLPGELSFPEADGAKWLVDGNNAYLDTSIRGTTGGSQDYFAGTLVGSTSNSLKMSVYVYIYDATNTLLDTLVLGYNVAL